MVRIGTGGVAERTMAPVLKTGLPKGDVGSNPTPSAYQYRPVVCAPRGGTFTGASRIRPSTQDANAPQVSSQVPSALCHLCRWKLERCGGIPTISTNPRPPTGVPFLVRIAATDPSQWRSNIGHTRHGVTEITPGSTLAIYPPAEPNWSLLRIKGAIDIA